MGNRRHLWFIFECTIMVYVPFKMKIIYWAPHEIKALKRPRSRTRLVREDGWVLRIVGNIFVTVSDGLKS